MRLETARNWAIIAGIAALVAFTPQGGDTADFVGSFLSLLVMILFLLIGVRLYQAFRTDIYGLGDRHRGLLYGALGLAILAMAASGRLFDSGAGTLLWLALMVGVTAALYTVWRQYRAYRI
jgi:hypothetical protein